MTRILTALFADPPAAGYTYTGGPAHAPADPLLGWLIAAAAVAVFVLLAWLAARIGDQGRPADKTPY